VPQSDAEAIKWYRLAADQGHLLAKAELQKLEKKPSK
jgi:TPR repeat protein